MLVLRSLKISAKLRFMGGKTETSKIAERTSAVNKKTEKKTVEKKTAAKTEKTFIKAKSLSLELTKPELSERGTTLKQRLSLKKRKKKLLQNVELL